VNPSVLLRGPEPNAPVPRPPNLGHEATNRIFVNTACDGLVNIVCVAPVSLK